MGESTGLLGVGDGVTKPQWANVGEATEIRDSRIMKTTTTELVYSVTPYSQAVDLGSMAVGINTVDIAVTSAGKVTAGDYVMFMGSSLPTGLDVQTHPAPAHDVIRLRIDNTTAAAIDPPSETFYFIIIKQVAR